MKYAHLADLHLGSWREQKMRDLSTKAFLRAMDQCIHGHVDFILFAGDIFDTSLPSFDTLKTVTKKLKEIKDRNIAVYVIAGSHDFSPSGKTMIDVLENAGLLRNVCKGAIDQATNKLRLDFTIDPKTGAKMTGILGRKGQLDKAYYQNLCLDNLEQEPGYKIFMFHTTLSEMKPKHLEKTESQPASFLPKGFDYYAGGHIHHPTKIKLEGYGTLTYPGALFPNNFAEVEKYGHGGYYCVEDEKGEDEKVEWIPVKVIEHQAIVIDGNALTAEEITNRILAQCQNREWTNTLITIRVQGTLKDSSPSAIDFSRISNYLYTQGAYFVMRNTTALQGKGFEEVKRSSADPAQVEEEVIKEHLQQHAFFEKEAELQITRQLLATLHTTKQEGETSTDFQKRIEEEMHKIVRIGY